jgi:hypothetical protein
MVFGKDMNKYERKYGYYTLGDETALTILETILSEYSDYTPKACIENVKIALKKDKKHIEPRMVTLAFRRFSYNGEKVFMRGKGHHACYFFDREVLRGMYETLKEKSGRETEECSDGFE